MKNRSTPAHQGQPGENYGDPLRPDVLDRRPRSRGVAIEIAEGVGLGVGRDAHPVGSDRGGRGFE